MVHAGTRPAHTPRGSEAWARVLLLLAVPLLLVLSGCMGGGPSGGGDVECSPRPTITSTPPTTATVGTVYSYRATCYYNCFLGTCFGIEGVDLPEGVVVSSPLLSWTPFAAQGGNSYPFRIRTEDDFCGDSVSQSWRVFVYEAPEVSSFTAASPALRPGGTTQLTAVFSGGFGEIGGIGPISSGVPVATPELASTTAFFLTVMNPAGVAASRTLVVDVFGGPPTVTRFAADREVVTRGDVVLLRWETSDATALRLDPGALDVSGSTSVEVFPSDDTEYILTATNPAWGSTAATAHVRVVPPPSIASFKAAPGQTGFQGSVDLTAVFEGGLGRIDGVGPVASGLSSASGPLASTTLFRLVVTNAAGTEATRELLVPLTGPGTWVVAEGSPVAVGRYRHTATLLRDGRVFLAGGYALSPGASGTTEFFDPATETFSAGPALGTARVDHLAALLEDGRVLLVGGNSEEARRSAEIFDPGANALVPTGPPAYGWYGAAASLSGGDVLVLPNQVGQDAERFNALSETFSSAGPMLAFHGVLQAIALRDGRILIVDGNSNLWCELYDPVAGTFSKTGTVRRWRPHFAAAPLPDGRVLVAGDAGQGTPAEVYDPATGLFSDAGPEAGLGAFPVATALADGTVLLEGGQAAERFEPTTGTFLPTGGLLVSHGQHTATRLLDGRVFVVGGSASSPELYTP